MPIIIPSSDTFPIEELESYVLPFARTAPIDAVTHCVRLAAADFCRRTLVWKQTLPTFNTVANQQTYDLDKPADSTIFRVERVMLGDIDLTLTTPGRALADTQMGSAWLDSNAQVNITPAPNEAGITVTVDATLIPSTTATTLPIVLKQFGESFGFGALARLMRTPGVDWTDAGLSAVNQALFDEAIRTTALRVSRGFSRAVIRSRRDPRSKFY